MLSDSRQCGSFALKGSVWCFSHDPSSAEQKRLAVIKGGEATRQYRTQPPVPLNTPTDMLKALADTFNGVRSGQIAPRQAQAQAALANTLLKCYELVVMDDKLRSLESQASMHLKVTKSLTVGIVGRSA